MNQEGTVNNQITDSVTQLQSLTVGSAPAQAMGLIDIVSAETLGMFMHNAVSAQQNAQMTTSASIVASCAKMLNATPQIDKPAPPTPPKPTPPFMPLSGSDEKDDLGTTVNAAEYEVNKAITEIDKELSESKNQSNDADNNDKKLKAILNNLMEHFKKEPPTGDTPPKKGSGDSGSGSK